MTRKNPSPSPKARIDAAWRAEARKAGATRFRPLPRGRQLTLSGPAWIYIICIGLLVGWYAPDWRANPPWQAQTQAPASEAIGTDMLSADFGLCFSGGGTNCVVDGDTFWFRGEKVRIADIDTPETHGPRCAAEGALGERATMRLQALMNAGPFTLESGERETDRYGRALRVVTRDGRSIGGMLVGEGLARDWDGARHPWC